MRIRWMVSAAAAVLVTAARSSGSGHAFYLVQPAASCPAVDALTRQRSAAPLPADFRPVPAVRCTFRLAVARSAVPPSAGVDWVAAQRSVGPFDALDRALLLPPRTYSGEVACPAVLVMPVLLALTDASGRPSRAPRAVVRSPRCRRRSTP